MDCKTWRERASDYVEGTLPPATMTAMQTHTATCASCAGDETALRVLWREMNVLPSVDPPLFFRDNVLAAIERQSPARLPWWQTVLPQLGRVAVGTALTGGVAAALAWTLLLPHTGENNVAAEAGIVRTPILNLLPGATGAENTTEGQKTPALRIGRVTTMTPGDGPAYYFSFWLENADQGTARWNLKGDKTAYRFNLRGASPEQIRVPFASAQGKKTLDLFVYWTANGKGHTRHLFLPIPQEGYAAPAERQSFGLGEQTILETAREIASRYGSPVAVDDAPDNVRVRVTARDEPAVDALRQHLNADDFAVSSSPAGILIEPTPGDAKTMETPPAAR